MARVYHAQAVEIKPLENMLMLVKFKNRRVKISDFKIYAKQNKIFEKLKDKRIFSKAKLSAGGYGIIWNKNIDIDVTALYRDGKKANWNDFKGGEE